MSRSSIALFLFLFAIGSAADSADESPQAARGPKTVYLDQGWSDDERVQFYFTTQGSQLVPYDWFLALEQADNEQLFSLDSNMQRLRFIPHAGDRQRNPDKLPIGFVKDDNPRSMEYIVKKSFLGYRYEAKDLNRTNAWLGLTCAACHTTDLQHAGKNFRIEGGPALADAEQFLVQLAASVEATVKNPEKMTRFAKRILHDTGYNATEEDALRQRVEAYSKVLFQLVRRSQGTTPYGFGRLDAFGAILNEICETSLELPENHFPADAPASYPFLWDTPQLDWVQWNGSIGNPMARNVGEVLGVFGQLRLLPDPPADQFRSTVRLDNLDRLEQHVAKLKAPAWPPEFGAIDQERASRGQKLFADNCEKCHVVRDAGSGKFPTRTISGHEYIKTTIVPVDEIGTDPKLADNFVKPLVKPGALAGLLGPPFAGMARVPRPVLLRVAGQGVIRRYIQEERLDSEQVAAIFGNRPEVERAPDPWAYKARPLNGIWATAPFLHNGSVPTLYDLLLPAYERPKSFFVGSRKFDTKRVGFKSQPGQGSFQFRVLDQRGNVIPGNSNSGHSGKFFTHRRSEDGSIREFNDEERWALVEYMKTLR